MFGNRKQELSVVVLRDSQEVVDELRAALETAPEEERAGLRRALELAERSAAADDASLRARWTRQRLASAGFEGDPVSASAVRILRQAEPLMSLRTAVALAREVAAERSGTPES